jgi:hypothetical protein
VTPRDRAGALASDTFCAAFVVAAPFICQGDSDAARVAA